LVGVVDWANCVPLVVWDEWENGMCDSAQGYQVDVLCGSQIEVRGHK
jgi:hypothetical protein